MSATAFSVDRRDIDFVLHEQLDMTGTLQPFARFKDFDRALYDTLLDEAQKLAIEVTAPINREGDRVGAVFDGKGNVTTPPGMKAAWDHTVGGGWLAITAAPELGGTGMPKTVSMAVSEMFTGANVSFSIYSGLTVAAANLLAHFAPEPWRETAARKLYAGAWAGTMCLTEAGAGTAVGDNRARATRTETSGVYHLEGEKVFISGGDHDLTENILHVVLARAPDAPAGTKGLSIFLCPKFLFAADGTLGERNGVVVAGIEEKMGIHASATCTLALGGNKPCVGYLMGAEGQGMEIMFHMMNEARIGVGIQGLSGAAAAYNYALAYAKERIQGTDIKSRDADAPRVAISRHPDVRRMLLTQKVLVETMRSLLYSAAHRVDRAAAVEDKAESEYLLGLLELMTPICKSHCSDMGFEVCRLAVQTFGGYGYVGEYPVEQCLRDQKIFSLYEGTNGVQAMDLLGRKMRKNNGALFLAWLNECNQEIDRSREAGFFSEVTAMEKARDSLGGAAMHLAGLGMQGNIHGAMLQASPFLSQFGTVVLGLHALWQARVAKPKLDADPTGPDAAFYKGKILNARFYCANILPQATAYGKAITTGDESSLDEALFA